MLGPIMALDREGEQPAGCQGPPRRARRCAPSAPTYMNTSAAVTRSAAPAGSDQRLQVGLDQPVIDALGFGLLQHRRRDVVAFEQCRERPQPLAHQAGAAAEIDAHAQSASAGPARSPRPAAPARDSPSFSTSALSKVCGILVEQRLDEGAGRRIGGRRAADQLELQRRRPRDRPDRASAPCARPRAAWSSAPAASCISPSRNQPSAQRGASSSAPSISSAAAAWSPTQTASRHSRRGGRRAGRRRRSAAVSRRCVLSADRSAQPPVCGSQQHHSTAFPRAGKPPILRACAHATCFTPGPEGLYCPPGDFFIDPVRAVDRALITHGHSDHARPGHAQGAGDAADARHHGAALRRRLSPAPRRRRRYGETIDLNGVA